MTGRLAFSILFSYAVAFIACGDEAAREARPGREPASNTKPYAEHMSAHFEEAADIQAAIIRGDIDAVREPAKWLAEHPDVEGVPENWGPYVKDLRAEARLVGEARTFSAASQATASLIKVCGACHEALGARTRIPEMGALGVPPAEQLGVVPHMLRHKWAADQMWMALVEPSGVAWQNAVEVLADAPLNAQDVTDAGEFSKDAGILTQQVHQIRTKAQSAADLDSRAEVYGAFLSTCATCHQILHTEIE